MYKSKDISVVIPTYNRPEDLKVTLQSLKKSLNEVAEIIVVDQSKDTRTKNLIRNLKSSKLKYIYSKTPSITIARNLGVRTASTKSKIICFLDDDVDIAKNYFEEIIKVFNDNPDAKAVSAFFSNKDLVNRNKLEIFLRKIFFINDVDYDRARILSAYGNTYPKKLTRVINAQWLPGVNMAYKREVFKEQKFDENFLGYAIAEDTDFSYRLYKKHPNSIFITPNTQINHRASTIERYPTKKMSYINQVDHFYFYFKNFNKNIFQKSIFIWSLMGISILRTLAFLFVPKKTNWLKLIFFFESLIYSVKNIKNIKNGKIRNF